MGGGFGVVAQAFWRGGGSESAPSGAGFEPVAFEEALVGWLSWIGRSGAGDPVGATLASDAV